MAAIITSLPSRDHQQGTSTSTITNTSTSISTSKNKDTIHSLIFPSSPISSSDSYAPSSPSATESSSDSDSDELEIKDEEDTDADSDNNNNDNDIMDVTTPTSSYTPSLRALHQAALKSPTFTLSPPTPQHPSTITITFSDPPRALLTTDSTKNNPVFGSSVKFAHEIGGVFSGQWGTEQWERMTYSVGKYRSVVEFERTVEVELAVVKVEEEEEEVKMEEGGIEAVDVEQGRMVEVKLLAWRGDCLVGGWLVGEFVLGGV